MRLSPAQSCEPSLFASLPEKLPDQLVRQAAQHAAALPAQGRLALPGLFQWAWTINKSPPRQNTFTSYSIPSETREGNNITLKRGRLLDLQQNLIFLLWKKDVSGGVSLFAVASCSQISWSPKSRGNCSKPEGPTGFPEASSSRSLWFCDEHFKLPLWGFNLVLYAVPNQEANIMLPKVRPGRREVPFISWLTPPYTLGPGVLTLCRPQSIVAGLTAFILVLHGACMP